ncbi:MULTISPECIES: hypothetical protein [unclassified Halorhabdus]|uniref:hypothetical protein n=1 Tax=unclassified Halorhabdus TaxID=2621901 RepID=UPI0023D9B50A|nr:MULTISPECIES: hypothetical protein [unclassified Halorhabdus]WEL16566.1 putative membrane protein [Halorhabdus sp. SVX81]WEL20445.1 putative membrane protein [Halorhabdus sp. BNX81]
MATNTATDETLADQIAMAVGGGLLLVSVFVMGLIEVITGSPYNPVREVVEGGRSMIVVNEAATFGPYIRGLLLTLGLVVLGVFAIYAFATKQHLE